MKKILALLGVGAAAYLLWMNVASAEEAKLDDPTIPEGEKPALPPPPTAPQNPPESADTFTDPGSGQQLDGPSGTIIGGFTYKVRRGESWSNIASRAYGDYRWWPALWGLNADRYADPERLLVGDMIVLPEQLDPAAKEDAFRRARLHANWWRGGRVGRNPAVPMLPGMFYTN